MELSDRDVDEYYQPKDFRIGGTIFVFGRRFLLLDCDKFTRQYYAEVLKQPQDPKLAIKFPEKPHPKRVILFYIFGFQKINQNIFFYYLKVFANIFRIGYARGFDGISL